MINAWLMLLFLALSPFSECRGAIIYGLAQNLEPFSVLFLAILANIAIIPVIFLILKGVRFKKLIFRVVGKRIARKIKKNKKRFELYEELALLFFVAIPLPFTGAYTSCLIAEALDLNRKKSFLVISLGVIIAALIVFVLMNFGLFVFNRTWKLNKSQRIFKLRK